MEGRGRAEKSTVAFAPPLRQPHTLPKDCQSRRNTQTLNGPLFARVTSQNARRTQGIDAGAAQKWVCLSKVAWECNLSVDPLTAGIGDKTYLSKPLTGNSEVTEMDMHRAEPDQTDNFTASVSVDVFGSLTTSN